VKDVLVDLDFECNVLIRGIVFNDQWYVVCRGNKGNSISRADCDTFSHASVGSCGLLLLRNLDWLLGTTLLLPDVEGLNLTNLSNLDEVRLGHLTKLHHYHFAGNELILFHLNSFDILESHLS